MSDAVYKPQRIKGIRMRNILGIEEADIEFDAHERLTYVFGPNGAGKSSIAKGIFAALGGAKACPSKPVRDGAAKAEVEIEMTDHTVTWEHNGVKAKLHVTNAQQSAPQGALNALLGATRDPMLWYPLRWLRADTPAERKIQADTLRQVSGVNTSEIETRRFKAEEARKELNQEVGRLKGFVKSLPFHDDAPEEPKSLKEIRDRQKVALAQQKAIDDAIKTEDLLEADILRWDAEAVRLRAKLAEAEEAATKARDRLDAITTARIELPIPDLASIEAELDGVESVNAKVAANTRLKEARADLRKQEEAADALTAKMKACDEDKAAMLAKATMPFPGLGFDGDTVTLNGVPLSQASQRQQIMVAASIGCLHGSPRLRFGWIEEGSLFDRAGCELLESVAEELDMHWLFEVVADLDADGEVETGGRPGVVVKGGHASKVVTESLLD